jgi:hypothetical protein
MTVANAVKGLKHVIQHREELIKGFDDMTKGWEDDCAKAMVDSIKDFMTRDIGSFEWILSELQNKKSLRYHMTVGKKMIRS